MIYYLFLLLIPLTGCVQSAAQKQYSLKDERPNVILFSAVTSLMVLVFFVLTSGFRLSFDARLIPYALGFAVCYAAAWVGTVLAVQCGLMAISTLIISCSIVFPTLYGVWLGEPVGGRMLLSLALLFASMVLVNLKFEDAGKFSARWLICVLVAFVGNGLCTVLQNMQKRVLGDAFSHEFMILSLLFAFVLLLGYALCTTRSIGSSFRRCLPYATANGLANAVGNLLVLLIIGNIPNTIFYPTNAALGMLATFVLAYAVYRERFSRPQYVGYALGVISIVLLNL